LTVTRQETVNRAASVRRGGRTYSASIQVRSGTVR